jgi:hypothetical protein
MQSILALQELPAETSLRPKSGNSDMSYTCGGGNSCLSNTCG